MRRREEIRARNLGVRSHAKQRHSAYLGGRFAHRIWEIIDRLRKPDGSAGRHNFLNAAAKGEGINPGHSHGAQWSRWNRFHGMKGGEPE